MDIRFWSGARTHCTVARWNNDVPHEPWSKLYCLASGRARYAVVWPGETPRWTELRPGSIYLVPGGCRQINACDRDFILDWCHFTVQDESLAARIAACVRLMAFPAADFPGAGEVIAQASGAGRLRGCALVYALLARLPEPVADLYAADRRRLALAVGYLEYHFLKPLTVAGLARLAGLSQSRFQTLFRRVYGTSVKAYQISLRLAEAKRLLRAGGYSVQEVAARCGYADNPFNFTRLFTQRVGISPTAWRAAGG